MNPKRAAVRTTRRRKWHRSKDRWTWMGWYNYAASPVKPTWATFDNIFTWLGLDVRITGNHGRKTTPAQRFSSLRKIAK